jgi:predicted nucleic acid-binding protein
MADALIDAHGPSQALRTLDALHLALALDLQRNGLVDSIMTADKVLCTVAPLEGLPVINPEMGTP